MRTIAEHRGPGRGRVRLCDAVVFKRAAVIAALNAAGLSTAVSGQIAYFAPYHTLLFTVIDPLTILFEHSSKIDLETGLPPRRAQPATDWFQPDGPAKQDPDSDWLIEIYDGRFVGCVFGENTEPLIFGELRNDRSTFVFWRPSHERSRVIESPIARLADQLLPYHQFLDFVAEWESAGMSARRLKELGYAIERRPRNDALRMAAAACARDFTFRTTVDISLAIKKALRRYLEIDPSITDPR